MILFSARKEGRQEEVYQTCPLGLYYASTTFYNFIVIDIGSRGHKTLEWGRGGVLKAVGSLTKRYNICKNYLL